MNRTKQTTIAAILQFLLSAFGIVASIPFLVQGAAGTEAPPFFVIVLAFIFAVLGMASAYGVWKNQKWGKILTIVLRAVDSLLAVPGVFSAPTPFLWMAATISVGVSIIIIVLLLWRAPRPATV